MNFRLPYPNVISAVPDFMMGLAFLATWIDPHSLGEDMVSYLFQVMLLEFIIIHSAGFMSGIIYGKDPKSKKVKMIFGLGLLYSLFVLGFSFGFKSWWPLITFCGLMFNRMMSVFSGQAVEGREQEFAKNMWGVNVGCYLISVFIAILIPLPALGISSSDLSHLNISGDFVEEPHRMMAWGFLYFCMVSWFEFRMPKLSFVQEKT